MIFLVLLISYAQNIPATDDFRATLQFAHNFLVNNLSPEQRIQALFAQHNEHRILVSRLLTLVLYYLTGEVNLAYFLYLDILFLVGLLAVLTAIYTTIKPALAWYSYLLPFLFLLSPHSYETFLFISGGSQSYPVLFFTTASIWLLYRASKRELNVRAGVFCLSVVSAWLATFSFGSGLMVWAGGCVFLFYKRQYRWLVVWVLMTGLSTGYYFYHYYRPVNNLAMTDPFSSQLVAFLKAILLFPGAAFIVHWPSFVVIQMQVVLCYGISLCSWAYILYLLITGYGWRNPLLFALLSVSLGIGFMLAISRIGVGSGFLFTSRYLVFTSLTPIVLYAIALDQQQIRFRTAYWPIIGTFLLFLSSLWTNLSFIEVMYSSRQLGFREWQRNGKPVLYVEPEMQTEADQITRQSIRKHIFVPHKEL